MDQQTFIELMAGYVRKYAPQFGVKVYSPIIAQAIIESKWGTSNKVINNGKWMHNYLGLKWRDNRCPISIGWFTETGSEQDANTGAYITSEMKWCKFRSMEECVLGYFQWTNIPRYSKAKGVTDPREYIEAMKDAGYATSIKYVNTIMNTIKKYNLTQYDNQEVVKMRIGLNAGHTLNGAGSGAVGVIRESDETRRICNAITPMFEAIGCEIVPCTVDRASTQNEYLKKVVEMANDETLDWFISIHFNNDAKKAGKGVEAYTYKGRQYPDAVELCEYISALGFRNRGVKSGSGLYVVRKTKAKSILLEVCFVNEPDASQYQKMFDEICKAIVYAMSGYVAEIPKVEVEVPVVIPEKKKYVKVVHDNLSVRNKLSWSGSAVVGTVRKNEVFTVADGPIKVGNGSMYKLKSGLYITAASKYVNVYEK